MAKLGQNAAEFFFFLGPFALAFTLLGMPGIRVAGLFLHPYQVALLLLLPVAGLIANPTWFTNLRQTPPIFFLGAALLLVVFSSVFLKRLPYGELREIKNTVLPLLLVLFAASRYLTTTDRARRLMLALACGITASLVIVYLLFGMSALVVRGIDPTALGDTVGLTYVWLGVGGSGIFASALTLLSHRTRVRSWFLPGCLFLLFGGFAMILSGTRAVVVGTLLFPLAQYFAMRVPVPIQRALVWTSLFAALLASSFPGIVLDIFPYQYFRVSDTAHGADRLVDVGTYGNTLGSRFTYWSWMLDDRTPSEYMYGSDYTTVVGRVQSLGHPHNLFVWGNIMGGLPVAILLFVFLGKLLTGAIDSYRRASANLTPIARANYYLVVVLLPVLFTNSLPGGTHLLFGATLALSVFLNHQTSCAIESLSAPSSTRSYPPPKLSPLYHSHLDL